MDIVDFIKAWATDSTDIPIEYAMDAVDEIERLRALDEEELYNWVNTPHRTPDAVGCLLGALFIGACWGLAVGTAVIIYRVLT